MIFSEKYRSHAYFDLIEEAEKQGIDSGVIKERSRIVEILKDDAINWGQYCELPLDPTHCQNCWQYANLIRLIEGE
jgi:hypothetical protein